MPVAWTTFLQD